MSAAPIDADAPVFTGFRYDTIGECLYWLLAACTGFISLLLAIWFPALFARLRYRACAAADADFFIATVRYYYFRV